MNVTRLFAIFQSARYLPVQHEVYRNNPRTEDDLRHGMQDFISSSTYNEHFSYLCVCVSAIQMTMSSTFFKYAMRNIELQGLGPNSRKRGSAALSYV